jgi:Cys-rich repeat protein
MVSMLSISTCFSLPRRALALLLVLAAAVLLGCGDDAESTSCEADCPAAFCQADGACSAVRCDAPGSCPVDQYCDTTISRCLPGCETQDPCDGGLVCDPQTHQCVGCNDDANRKCLPIVGVCNEKSGRCVQCVGDLDCDIGDTGAFCQPTLNTCVPGCVRSLNCPVSLVCDIAARVCVQCLEDTDCTGICDAGRCVECVQDPGCGVGSEKYCDTAIQACVPGCVQDISCPQGKTCDTASRACK